MCALAHRGVLTVAMIRNALAALGFVALLLILAVLYDILTDGDKRMWKEARYDGFGIPGR